MRWLRELRLEGLYEKLDTAVHRFNNACTDEDLEHWELVMTRLENKIRRLEGRS